MKDCQFSGTTKVKGKKYLLEQVPEERAEEEGEQRAGEVQALRIDHVSLF